MLKNDHVKILTIFIFHNSYRKLCACSKILQILNTVVWTLNPAVSSSMQWYCTIWHHVPCKVFKIKMFKIEVFVKSHHATEAITDRNTYWYHIWFWIIFWPLYTQTILLLPNVSWSHIHLQFYMHGIMTYSLKLYNIIGQQQSVLHSGWDPQGNRFIRMSGDACKSRGSRIMFVYSKLFRTILKYSWQHSENTWGKVI